MANDVDRSGLDIPSLHLLEALHARGGQSARDLSFATRLMPAHCGRLLRRLEHAGWVTRTADEPNRFDLSDSRRAEAEQALGRLSETNSRQFNMPPASIRIARTCYGHFAGLLGTRLTDALVASGALARTGNDFTIGDPEAEIWATLAVDPKSLVSGRPPISRGCLDWSERRPHLAGRLGKAIADAAFASCWVARPPKGRGILLTPLGAARFGDLLGITTGDLPMADLADQEMAV